MAKPEKLTFEEATSVPVAALSALQGLRDKGWIQPGHKVLINGAGGGVGTFAVQIAKSFGAEVTGVCGTKNVDMVRVNSVLHGNIRRAIIRDRSLSGKRAFFETGLPRKGGTMGSLTGESPGRAYEPYPESLGSLITAAFGQYGVPQGAVLWSLV